MEKRYNYHKTNEFEIKHIGVSLISTGKRVKGHRYAILSNRKSSRVTFLGDDNVVYSALCSTFRFVRLSKLELSGMYALLNSRVQNYTLEELLALNKHEKEVKLSKHIKLYSNCLIIDDEHCLDLRLDVTTLNEACGREVNIFIA